MNNIAKGEKEQKSVFVDKKTQEELNKPLSDPIGISRENHDFLEKIVDLIEKEKIDLYKPETLINREYYDKLTEREQGKADFEAVNLLSALREIKDLYDLGKIDTYQMQNLLERIRNTKERLEEEGGDLFII
ncbi:hypothetical protein GF366_04210 [Candidatus Peregrinibacteria bacterium]|nr:hypothetical protein [Candidatus Peregrinibacteria bacterium]